VSAMTSSSVMAGIVKLGAACEIELSFIPAVWVAREISWARLIEELGT
jgi:hypothetical protein